MAKSPTRKKASKQQVREVEELTVAATEYLRRWTKTEARKLANREIVILPASWGFQVGKYSVKEQGTNWQVFNSFGELNKTFTGKKSAVTWCILEQSNIFSISDRLLDEDLKLSKLLQDQINYSYSKQKAIKKQDMFAVDVFNARLAETAIKLDRAKQDLEKTLIRAKYLKGIWEKPL